MVGQEAPVEAWQVSAPGWFLGVPPLPGPWEIIQRQAETHHHAHKQSAPLFWPSPHLGIRAYFSKPCWPSKSAGLLDQTEMGKMKQHVEGRTKEDRSKVRKSLGTLKQLTVQPKTRQRYEQARKKFYSFLKENLLQLPTQRDKLDDILAEYIEHLWSSGEGRGLASDTVAGLQDLDPRLKGHLMVTWRLLKTWHVNEVPNRAPPIPEVALRAMVGWAIFHDYPAFAVSLLIGFYGLLRTGEIHDLTAKNIFMNGPKQPAVVSLGLTKGGKRIGAAESVTIPVTEVLVHLWKWKRSVPEREPLVHSSHQWRTLFSKCLNSLGLDSFGFRPYSLRRGGSTAWFHKHGNMDRLLVLGRWQASRTAKIYINSGLAMLSELTLPQKSLKPFLTVYSNSLSAQPKTWANSRELERGTWNYPGGEYFFFRCINKMLGTWDNLGLARPQGAFWGATCYLRLGVR